MDEGPIKVIVTVDVRPGTSILVAASEAIEVALTCKRSVELHFNQRKIIVAPLDTVDQVIARYKEEVV